MNVDLIRLQHEWEKAQLGSSPLQSPSVLVRYIPVCRLKHTQDNVISRMVRSVTGTDGAIYA